MTSINHHHPVRATVATSSTGNFIRNPVYSFNPITSKTLTTTNSTSESEKLKFLNILESLFDVFDPEHTGYIDINELDKFSGKNNEILKEVIVHVRSRPSQPFDNSTNRRYDQIKPSTRMISFQEFVKAADQVLGQRKINKMSHSLDDNTDHNRANCTPLLFSSSSSSSMSSPTSSSSNGTLSQAFESQSTTCCNDLAAEFHHLIRPHDNMSSLDLANLIDRESHLLRQGLQSLDSIRAFYINQQAESRHKMANINRLKHQNLFTIDKMLTELKSLADFNQNMSEFLAKNGQATNDQDQKSNSFYYGEREENENGTITMPVEATFDSDQFDQYLRQKQTKIENLQREKSQLIRKLYEIKSESESINVNLSKLQQSSRPHITGHIHQSNNNNQLNSTGLTAPHRQITRLV